MALVHKDPCSLSGLPSVQAENNAEDEAVTLHHKSEF